MSDPTVSELVAGLRRLRVDEYHRIVDAGVFDEDDRVELLEGVIVEMSPHGTPHAQVIQALNRVLTRGIPEGYVVRPQLPLTLADSEPEPDVAVVVEGEALRSDRHPSTAALVVEVSGDSLGRDRLWKGRIYARARIPEYWIVDAGARTVEVYRDPDTREGRYQHLSTMPSGTLLEPTAFPGLSIPVDGILPR